MNTLNAARIDVECLQEQIARNMKRNHKLHEERCQCEMNGKYFGRRNDLVETIRVSEILERKLKSAQARLTALAA